MAFSEIEPKQIDRVVGGMCQSRVPTLWLLGERDESVPTFASVRVLDSIRAAGNLSHTVIVYADTAHGLRNVTTGDSAPLWADALSWLQDNGVMPHAAN